MVKAARAFTQEHTVLPEILSLQGFQSLGFSSNPDARTQFFNEKIRLSAALGVNVLQDRFYPVQILARMTPRGTFSSRTTGGSR